MRKTFDLTDASSVSLTEFTIDYDDGYAAYLNGTLIASGNAPETVTNTSFATGSHEAGVAVTMDLTSLAQAVLLDGTNVLALVCLNKNSRSSDMSIIPELRITSNSEAPVESASNISPEGDSSEDPLSANLYNDEVDSGASAPQDTLISSSILTGSAPVFEELHEALLVLTEQDFILEIITAEGEYLIAFTYGEELSSSMVDDFTFSVIYTETSDIEDFIKGLFIEDEIIDILIVN